MDASTSQDVAGPIIPAKCPKTSPDSNSPTVSEQLHLLTTQVDQLRITSEQALEQTKPLTETFSLANIKHFQYFHAVQHQVAHFIAISISRKMNALSYAQLFASLKMGELNCVDRLINPHLLLLQSFLLSTHLVLLLSKIIVPKTMSKCQSLRSQLLYKELRAPHPNPGYLISHEVHHQAYQFPDLLPRK